MALENVRILSAKQGDRIAVVARKAPGEPWIQVESVLGEQNAQDCAEELDADAGKRSSVIDEFAEDEWGTDAPAQMPGP